MRRSFLQLYICISVGWAGLSLLQTRVLQPSPVLQPSGEKPGRVAEQLPRPAKTLLSFTIATGKTQSQLYTPS